MKRDKQDLARKLRAEGRSIREIEKIVECSRSSISRWTSKIELTLSQIEQLESRNPSFHKGARLRAAEKWSQRHRGRRVLYQKEGALRVANDHIFLSGCLLYWAEGGKSINQIQFTNSDPNMMKFFFKFLSNCLRVPINKIKIYINCYTDIAPQKEIEEYWLTTLNLPQECLGPSTVNYHSKYSQNKRRGKLKWGTCRLQVSSTQLVQQIYGGIQSYIGFENPVWLG